MLSVTIATTEVKNSGLHFLKKSTHLSLQQSNLICFLKLSRVQEYLKHPRGPFIVFAEENH